MNYFSFVIYAYRFRLLCEKQGIARIKEIPATCLCRLNLPLPCKEPGGSQKPDFNA